MSVYERLMAPGSWSLKLDRGVPWSVRNAIVPFSHVVITPTRSGTPLSDAQMLSQALYTGVVLRPGPQLDIGGAGLARWLEQPVATRVAKTAATVSAWVTDLLPSQLTVGSISASSTLTTDYFLLTKREAIDSVVRYYGQWEWRVNPDFTFDAGTAATLFGSTPSVIAVRGEATSDGVLRGIGVQTSVQVDFEDWASRIYLLGPDNVIGSSGGTSVYRDNNGALIEWARVVEGQSSPAGQESATAAIVLADVVDGQTEISIATSDFAATRSAPVGSLMWVYDPDTGLIDTDNQVVYQGQRVTPMQVRVMGATWPVTDGMGVWLRTHDGSTVTYTDLTDWVVAETGQTTFEVGAKRRGLDASVFSPPKVTAQRQASPWTGYTPTVAGLTLGNGTVSGAYRATGTQVALRGIVTAGTTSANGAGAWTVSLPSGMTAATGQAQLVTGLLTDASAGQLWRLVGLLRSGATVIDFVYGDASGLSLAGAQPITIGSGDKIEWSGVVQVQ